MSYYSDLPDSIKKALEDLLESLSGLSKEQVVNLLSEMLGEEGLEELAGILDHSNEFSIEIEDEEFFELDQFIQEIEEFGDFYYGVEEDIEPYFEISHREDESEIIIEMPGLEYGLDMIEYFVYDHELFVHSINSVEQYKLVIPVPEFYHLKEDQMRYTGGLFILPFEIK